MATKNFSVTEWFDVKDNPRQRDTEYRAAKWRRSRKMIFVMPHRLVTAASMNGSLLCKIDGHTRSFLWEEGSLELPPLGRLQVDVLPVSSLDEAAELYMFYDGRQAVKSSGDEIAGACHEVGLTLKSGLLKRHRIANAIALCSGAQNSGRGAYDLYESLSLWANELVHLDSLDLKMASLTGPQVAAVLLLLNRHGVDACRDFVVGIATDGGEKTNKGRDAVDAVVDMMKTMTKSQKTTGWGNITNIAGRIIWAYESVCVKKKTVANGSYLRFTDPHKIAMECMASKRKEIACP